MNTLKARFFCILAVLTLSLPAKSQEPGENTSEPAFQLSEITNLPLDLTPITFTAEESLPVSDTRLVVEVWRNGFNTGTVIQLVRENGELLIAKADLSNMGFRPDILPGTNSSEDPIPLSRLDGFIDYEVDELAQTLQLSVATEAYPNQHIGYKDPGAVIIERQTGLTLNYDFYGQRENGQNNLGLVTDARLFGKWGAIENTALSRLVSVDNGDEGTIRLNTRWTYASSDRMDRWTVGDTNTGSLSWSRSLRIGGIQWRRDYSSRPDMITFPTPSITTDALVPSSLDLYIEGVKRMESEVQDGPVLVDAIPGISGAGEMTVIMRDILGRETVTTLPFYTENAMLAEGKTDFSLEAGLLRNNFATTESTYGDDMVFSAMMRKGFNDNLTPEVHLEAGEDVVAAGVGALWMPTPLAGVFNLAVGASKSNDQSGHLMSAGYRYRASEYGVSMQVLKRSTGYRDLGDISIQNSAPGFTGLLSRQYQFSAYQQIGKGTLSISYIGLKMQHLKMQNRLNFNWRQNLGSGLSVFADLFSDTNGDIGGGLSFTLSLGNQHNASANIRSLPDTTEYRTSISKRPVNNRGLGWTASAVTVDGRSNSRSGRLAADYDADRIELSAGVETRPGFDTTFVQARGSIVTLGQGVFLGRPINDSFAVVSTPGLKDIPVLNENRLTTHTNDKGYALIYNMNSWQENQVSIDIDALPVDVYLAENVQLATTADRSGVMVKFPVKRRTSIRLRLKDSAGNDLPAGTLLYSSGNSQSLLTGYDGEVFVEDISLYPSLEAQVNGSACRFDLNVINRDEISLAQAVELSCGSGI